MRTTSWTCLGTLAVLALPLSGSGMALAQEATVQSKVEDFQQRYEEAVAAGDWEAMTALFTESATILPMNGGLIEGPQETRSYYEQSGLTRVDARSAKTETLADNLIFDFGSFTATFSGEAGAMEVDGEYVAIAEDGEDGLRLRSLTTFPKRQSLSEPAQE